MTIEERIDWLCRLRADLNNGVIFTPWNKEFTEALTGILEQQFCEDEYIKVPKKALKYRTAGMVAYNVEWLKNHFDIERAVIRADDSDLENPNKWIPVERELPEKGRQVLCCNEQGSVFTSAITYIKKYKDGNRYVCFGQHCGVVAWMPLPKPYEPQEGDSE